MLFRVYGNSEVVHIHCTLGIEYCRKYNAEYGTAKCHTAGKKEVVYIYCKAQCFRIVTANESLLTTKK